MKNILTFLALIISVTTFAQTGPIMGPPTLCEGETSTYTSSPSGGTWSSSNPSVGTVDALTGMAGGVLAGTFTISYTDGTSTSTLDVTVNPMPAAIGCGSCNVCEGATLTLTDAIAGGTWLSVSPGTATVDATTGVVTGVSAGTAMISYSLPGGCAVVAPVVVNPAPVTYAVTGSGAYCTPGPGIAVGLSGSQMGVDYQVYCGVTPVGSSMPGTGAALSFGLLPGPCAYTVSASYPLGCTSAMTGVAMVVANPTPVIPTTSVQICAGTTTSVTATPSGGNWGSSNTSVATVGLTSGTVTGVGAGVATISYVMPATGCFATIPATVNPNPSAITGTAAVCEGYTTTLSSSPSGGIWTSAGVNATVGASTGLVTGITSGTEVITYTLPTGCRTIANATVNPVPAPITGTTTVCVGSTTGLFTPSTGGMWTSSSTGLATVGSATGTVTGVSSGTPWISYTYPTGCYVTTSVNVISAPAPITGPSSACVFGTITLADATPGGSWSSSNPAAATIDATTGLVTGIAVGGTSITYNFGGGCYTTTMLSVNPLPVTISGPTGVCIGFSITLTDATAGGTWSSAGTHATVNPSTGAVTGVSAGLEIVTYTMPTGCFTTYNVNVASLPCTTLGVEEVSNMQVELFPNPAYDELVVKTVAGVYTSYTVTNSVGQVMMQHQVTGAQSTINVRELPSAVYFITLKGGDGTTVRRFVKN